MAGVAPGSGPLTRYVRLSTPIRLASGIGALVQCRVTSSVRRSAVDQTLKYGSCATRGTAGGRKPSEERGYFSSSAFAPEAASSPASASARRDVRFIGEVSRGSVG